MDKKEVATDVLESINICRKYLKQCHKKWSLQNLNKEITEKEYGLISNDIQWYFGHLIGMHSLDDSKEWINLLIQETEYLEEKYFKHLKK